MAFVLARTESGTIDASATVRPSSPWRLPYWSTTAQGSEPGPILQVPVICWAVVTSRLSHRSSASSDSRSDSGGSRRRSTISAKAGLSNSAHAGPDTVAHPRQIVVRPQQVVEQLRLDVRVEGAQANAPPARGQVDGDDDAYAERGHLVAAPGGPLGCERLHPHDHVVRARRRAGGVAQGDPQARAHRIERRQVPHPGGDEAHGVVAQVLADPLQAVHHRDAHLPEMLLRADAGEHQYVGAADRPRRQDGALRLDREQLAAALDLQPGHPPPLDDETADRAVGPDGESEDMPDRSEIGQRGAHADVAGVVEGERADAGRLRVVEVLHWPVPGLHAGIAERPQRRGPLRFAQPPAGNGAVDAVEVVGEVHVRLQPSEEGQHLVEAPLGVSAGGPSVEVVGQPPQEHLAVDRAGAARDAAPGDEHRLRALVGRPGEVPAVLLSHHHVRAAGVPVLELVRQSGEVGVVGAGFQEQDRSAAGHGEPGRDDGSGGAGAHYYEVIPHGSVSPISIFPRGRREEVRISFRGTHPGLIFRKSVTFCLIVSHSYLAGEAVERQFWDRMGHP